MVSQRNAAGVPSQHDHAVLEQVDPLRPRLGGDRGLVAIAHRKYSPGAMMIIPMTAKRIARRGPVAHRFGQIGGAVAAEAC